MPAPNSKKSFVLAENGTLYHIGIYPDDGVPPNVFLVGESARVDEIARHFETVHLWRKNLGRPEFYAKWGTYHRVPMMALSIGIVCDNMEIALNELHALFEYDFKKDRWKHEPARLTLIRVGTSGTSLPDIPLGTIVISDFGIGLDALGAAYPAPSQSARARKLEDVFRQTRIGEIFPWSYCAEGTSLVADTLEKTAQGLGEKEPYLARGATTSSPGFFAPEGRSVGRIKTAITEEEFIEAIRGFHVDGVRIINHEMEASILYRIGNEQLGYRCGAICVVLDNVADNRIFSGETKYARMDLCIKTALETMAVLAKIP